jgi:outer membrane protein assembly factor BamB
MFIRLTVAMAALAAASDWPKWRGPEGTGISGETEWKAQALNSPKVLWKNRLGEGYSCVSVVAKRLYTMGNQGGNDIVYCMDAETGKEIWRHAYRCPPGGKGYKGPRATPVVDGDLVFTLSQEGQAFCLEAATGKVKWQKDLLKEFKVGNVNWGMSGSALVVGETVYYNAGASGLALKKATGEKVWAGGGGEGGYATPVHFMHEGKALLALFSYADLILVDAATGRKVGSYPWQTEFNVNAADPIYCDGKLFITSGYEKGAAMLDLAGGSVKPAWETREMRGHFSTPIYLDGHLYGVDGQTGQGQLRCVDAKTGKIKWTNRGRQENLTAAGGKLIVIDEKGAVTVVEANPAAYKALAQGTVLAGRAKNWTAPVLANSLLYCRNSEGDLVCVDLR